MAGTLAVGVVVQQKAIDLNQSLLTAYRDLWAAIGVPWLGNVMAAMLAFGVLGQVSVVVAGPSTGLLAVGKAGYLPHVLQRTNAHGMPVPILLLQAVIVTVLCLAFTVLPSVQSAYQILSQMATIIYLLMYVIMYVAAIRLRYTQPDKLRPFRIPGGSFGMWFVGIVGLVGALIATAISFIPPTQISTGSPVIYVGILLVGTAIFAVIPFVLYAFHKPAWKAPGSGLRAVRVADRGSQAGAKIRASVAAGRRRWKVDTNSFIAMIVGLFAITAPIAVLPIFVAATEGQTGSQQRRTAMIAVATYVGAGAIALFVGNAVLGFFGAFSVWRRCAWRAWPSSR